MTLVLRFIASFWGTLAEMAPYLLLGFAVAGVLSVWVSQRWIERHLGGGGGWASLKAALFAVPLPLCSCGVIPVAASLRRHGASKGATTSFLIATPQTGAELIFAAYALLGPVFAVILPVFTLLSGVIGGSVVDAVEPRERKDLPLTGLPASGNGAKPTSMRDKLTAAAQYALITLPADIARPLLLGIAIAAAITIIASPDSLESYLGGFTGMLIMLVVGVPMYVCSIGSIPMAVSFMYLGASPGAALVFLVTGPATNVATIAVAWKMLGRRATLIYLATIVLGSFAAGLVLNAIVAGGFADITLGQATHLHGEHLGVTDHIFAGLLVAMMGYAALRPMWRTRPASVIAAPAQVLHVEGMTCEHCVDTVTRTLREQAGVTDASVELASGRATVVGEQIDAAALIRAVEGAGFRATSLS